MATYSFLTLCTKLTHDKLKFRKQKTFIRLSNNVASYWRRKTKGGLSFSKSSLKTAINHLLENC